MCAQKFALYGAIAEDWRGRDGAIHSSLPRPPDTIGRRLPGDPR